MKRGTRQRAQRGYMMLMVLGAVAVMTTLGATLYVRSEEQLLAMRALKGASLARTRADLGLQAALAKLRGEDAATVSAVRGLAVCGAADWSSCGNNTIDTSLQRDGPLTADLDAGGGMIFRVQIRRRDGWTVEVRSTGYYGYPTSGDRVLSSVVEAEVSSGNAFVNVAETGYANGG
jgi:hypothetical protein